MISVLFGWKITGFLGGNKKDSLWVRLPAAYGFGTLVLTWALYLICWVLHVKRSVAQPLFWGNIVVMGTAVFVLIVTSWGRGKRDHRITRPAVKEIVFYLLLFAFAVWNMFFVFQVSGTRLYSGLTVFGDYAPHTAMIRSFSRMANYPTQYPHFGGEDIKYHFMFQFLVGNLEYLGLRIDIAYNLAGALSLTGFLMILSQVTYRLTRRFTAAVFSVLFFFFRSGIAFYLFASEHLKTGDLLETIRENTVFIGYSPNENWGLWCFNVYLNQRHLAFGLLIAAAAVWFYLDYLEEETEKELTGFKWILDSIFGKNSWKGKAPLKGLLLGVLLGLSAFWNGAALIGALLILFGMAVFSAGKLDYLLTAVMSVALSFAQTRFFMTESTLSPAFHWGFILEDKSFHSVLMFILEISGVYIAGTILVILLCRREKKVLAFSFLLPVVFALTVSLTPDVTVNHKYIMISMAFLGVFWGGLFGKIFSGGLLRKAAAVILAVLMCATGIYDYVVIIKDNDKDHRINVDLESPLTQWLNDHLTEKDLVLTPYYSISDVTMSGIMMYMGWPYYAWSAGYNTYFRADVAKRVFSTRDPEELKSLVEQEGIDYILYEKGMVIEEVKDCRDDLIAEIYPMVYSLEDRGIRIYETD